MKIITEHSWREGGPDGKDIICRRGIIESPSSDPPSGVSASALGLREIWEFTLTSGESTSDSQFLAIIIFNGDAVLFKNVDTGAAALLDENEKYRFVVKGQT